MGLGVSPVWGPIPWKYWSHQKFLGSIGHTKKTKPMTQMAPQSPPQAPNSLEMLVTFPL